MVIKSLGDIYALVEERSEAMTKLNHEELSAVVTSFVNLASGLLTAEKAKNLAAKSDGEAYRSFKHSFDLSVKIMEISAERIDEYTLNRVLPE